MQVPALLSLGVTLGLVLVRPRIRPSFRVGPALSAWTGVLVMVGAGLVGWADLASTGALMTRPLIAVASIMVTTAVAQRVGLMRWLAGLLEGASSSSPARLFNAVYALGSLTAAVLNNDSAILLLTPLVLALARHRYPGRERLHVAFVFAVFMSAGVAPLVVSNPMNMIVAAFAGIDFNAYAARMVPIALAGWVVGLGVLRLVFRSELSEAVDAVPPSSSWAHPNRAQIEALGLVGVALCAYPAVAYARGPVWAVALGSAVVALVLARRHGVGAPALIVREGVGWDVLAFLVAVSVLGVGLRHAGLIDRLAQIYARGGTAGIAVVSALGSAVVNNHPMSVINMFALERTPGAGMREALAALIGGDLGPRLLPMGSLAGLLWMEALRKHDLDVSPLRFAAVGLAMTVPTLAVSLALLHALP